MGLKKEPTEGSEREFNRVETLGDVDGEEFSGIYSMLSGDESIEIVSGIDTRGGKRILAVTVYRVIFYNSSDTKLLGKKKRYRDIGINSIRDIDVEDRNDFDIIRLSTGDEKERFMVPNDAGMRISGVIRKLQSQKDPLKALDRLSKQRDRENITEEEFDRKKKELLDRV